MSRNISIFFDELNSPLGLLHLVFSGDALAEVGFDADEGTKPPFPCRSSKATASFKKQLSDYFSGRLRDFKQKTVFLHGTDFEHSVWLCIKDIPYGETRTYKWVAERIGKPNAFRAVGQALGKNPMPIVLPCHRVIESDGSLGGYSGGIDIKRRLLDLEYYFSREQQGITKTD